MQGDDEPLSRLKREMQNQIDELRRELQQALRGMNDALRSIREMIEDRDQH